MDTHTRKHIVRLNSSSKYGRSKILLLNYDLCDNCNTEQNVMCLDSSDNEYGFVKICKKCILDYFTTFEDNTLLSNKICRNCDMIYKISDFIKVKNPRKDYEICKECIQRNEV